MEAGDYTGSTSAASNGSNQDGHESPWVAHHTADEAIGRPELPVIAAFVGGFVFAKLLGRFGGGGDD